jgi:hypothetical protein
MEETAVPFPYPKIIINPINYGGDGSAVSLPQKNHRLGDGTAVSSYGWVSHPKNTMPPPKKHNPPTTPQNRICKVFFQPDRTACI